MNIVTFNVRICDDANGNSVNERAPRLKKILEKYNPDIVGFQEATPKWMEFFNEYYGEKFEIFNKYRALNNKESTPIIWKREKYDLIDKGYFWLSDTPWIESLGKDTWECKRICMWVLLKEKSTNKEFYYFNTHFGFGDEDQLNSVKLIKQTADILNAEAFILTGDFNMHLDSKAYTKMTEYYTDVNMATVKDTGTTFHNYGEVEDEHIDYCFINSKKISPINSKVIDDTVDGKYPSDHYGIYFELNIKD